MKKNNLILKSVVFLYILAGSLNAFAQGNVSELIKSSPADAKKLAQAYLDPFFKGLGVSLNSGWNNTAHSKNMGRFEIRFGLTGAMIPKSDETFDVTKIGLSNNLGSANSNHVAPTVGGKLDEAILPKLNIYDRDPNSPFYNEVIETFTLPQGQNLPFVPAPQLQGTVGLTKGIDITLRAMPKVNLGADYGSIGMIGGGAKIEILPLITGKGLKMLLPFDVAVAAGYTQFTYKLALNVPAPSDARADGNQNQDFTNQMVDAKFSGINVETILSKKLLFFTPFLSVGYNTSTTNAGLKGNYPIVTGADILGKKYTTFSNPISINNKDISGIRTNVGFQLKMAFLRLYASYSMAEYNSFNAGLGLGIGN